jgi:zeaxanthin epoxidase
MLSFLVLLLLNDAIQALLPRVPSVVGRRQCGTSSTAVCATNYKEYLQDGGFDNTCKAQIPLKIAVAGGGVGGMFAAYALQQKGFDVTLFEKASKFSRFGGPIQLASNALSCVNALSPELFDEIMTRFTFTGTRRCGIKDGIRNSWYSIFDAITNLAEWNNLPYTGVIDRPDLQEILLTGIKEGSVINSMGVKKYTENSDGTVDLTFEDGSEQKGFDLLIGADGIWSSIRAQMWNEPTAKPGTATYSGYTLFAAETIMDPNSDFFKSEGYFDAGYKVYIGPGKYFVTSDVGSGRIQWYAFLALPPGSKARSSNRDFVKEQFAGWTEEIHACLDNTPDEIIEQRDLYDRRPSVFKSWSKGHVTMLGDAVHPMMPNLGQGGCQAMEDGFVLTNLLCGVTDKSQLRATLQDYYQQRIVRSAVVQGLSRLSSDIIITTFTTPFRFDEFLKEGAKYKYMSPQAVGTSYMQSFLPVIFYAQFGFLYSFSPSNFGADKIRQYVKDSVTRNKAEAMSVYKELKDGYTTYFSAKTMQFMRYNHETKEISKVADAKDMRCTAVGDVCDVKGASA